MPRLVMSVQTSAAIAKLFERPGAVSLARDLDLYWAGAPNRAGRMLFCSGSTPVEAIERLLADRDLAPANLGEASR